MQVRLCMQRDEKDTFSKAISDGFDKKPKKVYIIGGKLKEGGLKLLEDSIGDSKCKFFIAIGIDKKNTTRIMLENLLNYTENVYIYSNNNIIEFDSNIVIFEYQDSSVMYITSSNLSESGMCDNLSIYTEITYNLLDKNEKEEYKNQLKNTVKIIEKEVFTKLEFEKIDELVKSKEIFTTNQYTHSNIRSISDLLGKKEVKTEKVSIKENNKLNSKDEEIDSISIDLSNNIDDDIIEINEYIEKEENEENNEIENEKEEINELDNELKLENEEVYLEEIDDNIEDVEEISEEEIDNDELFDIEDMLFSRSSIKLKIPEIKEENIDKTDILVEDESIKTKKVNLSNVANLIFELPERSTKKQDFGNIKIPNYIQKVIPEFFELSEKGVNQEINGSIYKARNISIQAVDVKRNTKYSDRDAKLMHKTNQTYITFNTNAINDIMYDEKDIVRIVKLSSDVYHIEIISKDMQEYKLWSKVCTQNFRASERKYGMM